MDVLELIKRGEGEQLEFKEGISIKEILETVCAFSNSKGGIILLGVTDSGDIKGINIGKKTVEDIVLAIENNIKPVVYPEVSILTVKGKKIIKIKVDEGKKKPYFFKGIAYKRVGKNNVKMDPDEITREIIAREKTWEFVERRIVGELSDIDMGKVREFIRMMKIMRNIRYTGDEVSLLKKLDMLEDGRVNLAGILMFGKDPQRKIPFAVIKAMRKVGDEIVDEALIEGRLDEQIDKALEFVRIHIPKRIVIEGGKRVEKWMVPEDVIREIITNAIVHRDYSISSPILLKYIDDEILVINPGGLIPPLSIDDLYKENHPSILRNPIIGKALFLIKYIEGWGEGITRIIEICEKENIPIPEFFEEKNFFYAKIKVIREDLSDIEKKIVEMARKGITSKDVALKFNISGRTAREILRRLYERGILKRRRKERGFEYYL